jgi:nitroreductase
MDWNTVEQLLTTTRSVRKRLDLQRAVDLDVVRECLEIAIQAPTGSNRQTYHFVVVTEAEKRKQIGDYYRTSFMAYARQRDAGQASQDPNDPRVQRFGKLVDSSMYLARHMGEVPVLLIACIEGRVADPAPAAQAGLYGSILPAAWSLMLALRARGLGAAWTTLHLAFEREIAAILGIPDNVTQAALLPVAYFTGDDFQPAKRIPAAARTYYDTWGAVHDNVTE